MTPAEIIRRLEARYVPHQRSRYDPISELVLTIISQNTSDANSRPAFKALREAFASWQQVAEAEQEQIAAAIRVGGLEHVKAKRIKLALTEILRKRGRLELDFLQDMPLDEAKRWLRQLPGVGPKTAACVLLFSMGMPALPVDTHVYRVARRLGLVSAKTSFESSHEILEALVPPEDVLLFHMLLIEHGRQLCKASQPACSVCPLLQGCPFVQSVLFGG